jgi:hypothetical protein
VVFHYSCKGGIGPGTGPCASAGFVKVLTLQEDLKWVWIFSHKFLIFSCGNIKE